MTDAEINALESAEPGTGSPPAVEYEDPPDKAIVNDWRRDSGPGAFPEEE